MFKEVCALLGGFRVVEMLRSDGGVVFGGASLPMSARDLPCTSFILILRS